MVLLQRETSMDTITIHYWHNKEWCLPRDIYDYIHNNGVFYNTIELPDTFSDTDTQTVVDKLVADSEG